MDKLMITLAILSFVGTAYCIISVGKQIYFESKIDPEMRRHMLILGCAFLIASCALVIMILITLTQ